MGFFDSLWDGVKSVGSDIWNTGKDLVGAGDGYDKLDDMPWLERTVMGVGSGIEGMGKSLGGMVGLDDYMPSAFTDAQNRIKMELAQQGHTDGMSGMDVLRGGAEFLVPGMSIPAEAANKAYNKWTSPELDENTASSLEMGSGVSGGGETSMKVYGGGVSGGGAGSSMGQSLGRALAIEQEPALMDENYNENNFSF